MRIEYTKDCLTIVGRRSAGDVEEVSDGQAAMLIQSGFAVVAKEAPAKEKTGKTKGKGNE